ncbi:MAG: hypothetical protein Q7W45_16290 [Bacteroidota bacterium]|nr:hypothetical protein [Bacteroidota bacterium]MDP3145424.1 hypothetical protein [Bacteroidota bacterium]MDP3557201.1 hypothetical protein [Bacteroidota bacterium]
MEEFVLSLIGLLGLIILANSCFTKGKEKHGLEINNEVNNEKKFSNIESTYNKNFILKNNQKDFLDFSGGTLGI